MKKPNLSPQKKTIATAAVTAALLGAFGTGAYCVAQSNGTFDPKGLASDYESGASDANRGYRMNHTDQAGDANRHQDQSEDEQDSVEDAEDQTQEDTTADDAFSGASTTTPTATRAYNITGEADGTGVNVNNGGTTNENNANSSTNGNDSGDVIIVPDSDSKGNDSDKGSGGDSDKDSGGDTPSPSPSPSPDPTPAPTPTDNSYKVLPNDPSPSKSDSTDTSLFPGMAGTTEGQKAETASEDEVAVSISQSPKQSLYYGQKLDAWTIFCALSTTYTYKPADSSKAMGYRWECSQDAFDSYPLFQIESWTDEDGNENPELCPESELTIKVRYRFAEDGTWRDETVTCEPQASRVYFLGQADADGNATVLGWTEQTEINLLSLSASSLSNNPDLGISLTERALRDQGYVGDDYTITHLLLGWEESGESLGYTHKVTPGRHVIQVAGYSDELPSGYTVRLQNYYVQFDGESKSSSGTLQTLIDVDESVLEGDGETELTLKVPEGIEAVDSYKDSKDRGATWSLSNIELPASVLYFNVDGPFMVQNGWKVNEESKVYASTSDGILTSKNGASYLGIPAALTELDVPKGVSSVQIQQVNALSRITVHGTDGEAPTIQTDNLSECVIVVDDDIFDNFVEENFSALAAADANGVTICRASDEDVQYTCSGGMVYSEDDLVRVQNTGSDTVFVQIPTNIKTGAFDGATDVTCLVLYNDEDCTLEKDSLAGSNVQTIVCFTEEQAAGVQEQLASAGAPNVHVILAQVSQEEMLYYVDGDEVTLLSDQGFASTFDGTITDEDDNKLQVNTIAPYAFAGDTDLAWVTLGESVTSIGAYAFQNCTSLQGLFIGATDEVTVGANALDGCDSLGFVASLSSNATFATHEVPNKDCSWYCLPDAEGHDSRFTYIEDYNSLSVSEQADGSLVLYAAENAGDDPFLVVSGGSSYEGTLTLPSSVVEILNSAFAGTGGSWDIDWSSAPNLQWIDRAAFAGSGYTGDLVIDSCDGQRESLIIGTNAFERCAGITSFSSDVSEVEIGFTAFAGCGDLASVSLTSTEPATIASGAFASCSTLTSITLGSTEAAGLNRYSPGTGFLFTDDAEDDAKIQLFVPSGSEEAYLQSWVYRLVGYSDYDDYYDEIVWEVFEETWDFPSDDEVRAKMAENLLEPENRLRAMMGMEQVDASTIIVDENQDGNDSDDEDETSFKFSEGEDGAYTLTKVPADATTINLDDELPEDCTSLTIGAKAFAKCENLTQVNLGTHVTAINSGAFTGCDGVTVVLPSNAAGSITLLGGSTDNPFTFGAEIALRVPENEQQALLAAWPMQCLGYADESELGDWLFDLFMDYLFDDDPTASAVNHINECLLDQENYLRGLMGLDEISSTDELAYQYEYSFDFDF